MGLLLDTVHVITQTWAISEGSGEILAPQITLSHDLKQINRLQCFQHHPVKTSEGQAGAFRGGQLLVQCSDVTNLSFRGCNP